MKFINLIVLAALCITTPALAYDMSYIGPIKSKETKSIKVHLPDGKSRIEVWSPNGNGKLTCKFATASYGGMEFEQTNTTKCVINPLVKNNLEIIISITNLENKDSDWRIWVHDQ